jgi:putative serine protease PepD
MTNFDYTPATPSPFGTETLVDAPTVELPYGPPPPPPAPQAGEFLLPPQPPKRRRAGTALAAAGALVAVALGSGVAGAEFATRNDHPATTAAAVTAVSAPPATKGVTNPSGTQPREVLAQVAAAVQPSVVSITVRSADGSGGEGSGVILSADGLILTNNHVAEAGDNGGTVKVTFSDGKTADATIVGRDAATDLAVIQAKNVSGLTPATLGDDTALHVGDTVLAIGSPLGLEGSVSSGIVSALHRPVAIGASASGGGGSLGDAIQTDAPINPGNSGGALVNMSGEVIGINTAIATLGSGYGGQGGSIGVGFAIPITHAKTVADQLAKGEKPAQAVLGVQVGDAPSGGALIASVTAGSAADKAGLKVGDIVTSVGDSRTTDASTLTAAIRARRPGDSITISYTRNGTPATATATLGTASAS